ncbi:MAG: SRPBCC family protein [Gemmatimonadetes bacterium]|nr:SRPBCC family protein [Gemmatimonadota bacterium]
MHTIDEIRIAAPIAACFAAAADVERWPDILPHYRWVRFRRQDGFGRGLVEMAARRGFGPVGYPVWWVSEMTVDESRPAVIYRHVEGITTGMDVDWTFREDADGATHVRIVHAWEGGPAWRLPSSARRAVADRVIGPVFIHHVASRTLLGIKRAVEAGQSRSMEGRHVL